MFSCNLKFIYTLFNLNLVKHLFIASSEKTKEIPIECLQ